MKHNFLSFPQKGKSYLPRYNSRRFPQTPFVNVAYKEDGKDDKKEDDKTDEIKTPADFAKKLDEMKAGLEAKAKADAKVVVDEQLTVVNKAIEDLKKATETKEAADKLSAEELKRLDTRLEITIKAFDLLQTRVKSNRREEPEAKSWNTVIKEAIEENTDNIIKFNKKEIKTLSIEIKAPGDVSIGNITGGSHLLGVHRPGIIMNQDTVTQMRELISVIPAGPGTDFYFMRENGPGEGAPAPVAEKTSVAATDAATGLKPQFDLDLVEASVKFETIAGWMRVSKKAMLNIPNFVAFLQKRLPVKLLDVESSQILYGNGVSPQIKGLLAAGNFVTSTSAASNLVERIIDDLALLEDTYRRLATGIAMRPVDYFSFFKNKATGSGEYDLPQGVIFQNGILYILGVQVAKTTALTTGDYIVGDFNMGTELLVQEGMMLQFFEQDGDNVKTNSVTARIEETVALPVYGPDYFIKGSSAGTSS